VGGSIATTDEACAAAHAHRQAPSRGVQSSPPASRSLHGGTAYFVGCLLAQRATYPFQSYVSLAQLGVQPESSHAVAMAFSTAAKREILMLVSYDGSTE
jgi:hypothetical protein